MGQEARAERAEVLAVQEAQVAQVEKAASVKEEMA